MTRARVDIELLRHWIEATFTRSPGPGGQNVNKVSTRVTLLFDFQGCPHLSEPLKARVLRALHTRLSRDGRVRVSSHRERTQARNRAAAESRLVELITEAIHVPRDRRATKPTKASRRRRLDEKRRQSERKQQRRRRVADD